MIDYRKLRFNNLISPEFKHLFWLIFWPIYGALFWFLEKGITLDYMPIESSLDALIPFCEFFVFPYYFWFAYLVLIHIHTLLFDIKSFKCLMYFLLITYGLTLVIYVLFPNMQPLRPVEFERDNFCVDIVKGLYSYDTNTNVCPSLHVVGSFAVFFTSWNCKYLNTTAWRITNIIITILISISTVFLKQHSIIDVFAALILVFAAYPIAYILPFKLSKNIKQKVSYITE